jgi:hypothetical protein
MPVAACPPRETYTTPQPAEEIPVLAQAGRPLELPGKYDGALSNTAVKVGGESARILAEGMDRLVVRNPRGVIGQSPIEIVEAGDIRKGVINSAAIALSADLRALRPGQSTDLNVRVSGLEGLPESAYPVKVMLTNLNPSSIRMSGGENRIMTISRDMVGNGGIANLKTSIRGVKAGAFAVSGHLLQ